MGSRNVRGRVLWHSLATSRKWTVLPGAACTPRELFTLVVASRDNLGRMQACPFWWKSEMYRTRSDVSPKKIATSLEHCHNVGLIYIYESEEKPLLQTDLPKLSGNMTENSTFEGTKDKWKNHIEKEPVNFVIFQLVSGIYRINYAECNPSIYGVNTLYSPKGLRFKVEVKDISTVEETSTVEMEILECWKEHHEIPKAQLTPGRQREIRARLKDGYGVEQIKLAIIGCRASKHHMGDNDRKTIYNELSKHILHKDKIDAHIVRGERVAEGWEKGRVGK